MKTKLMASLLMAGGLIACAPASAAAWNWTGTLAGWAAAGGGTGIIIDGDGDTAFKLYPTTTLPDGVGGYVTLSELEIGGKDFYDVSITWDSSTGFANGFAPTGLDNQFTYSLSLIGATGERITAAALDSAITGDGTTALEVLYDLPPDVPVASIFANLISTNGARDPINGYVEFGGRSNIGVVNYLMPSATGVFQDLHDSFVVTVPEPQSVALVGLGLLALALGRRRKA